MVHRLAIVCGMSACCLLAGCMDKGAGTYRSLGQVQYPAAFTAAQQVMAQYYSIASADAVSGVITSRPKMLKPSGEMLLSQSPTRELATIRLIREDGQILANASVALQHQGSDILRQMPASGGYDTVPNVTPAEVEAATTPEQNESWRTDRYLHDIEGRMLMDLYRNLHPQASQ